MRLMRTFAKVRGNKGYTYVEVMMSLAISAMTVVIALGIFGGVSATFYESTENARVRARQYDALEYSIAGSEADEDSRN